MCDKFYYQTMCPKLSVVAWSQPKSSYFSTALFRILKSKFACSIFIQSKVFLPPCNFLLANLANSKTDENIFKGKNYDVKLDWLQF